MLLDLLCMIQWLIEVRSTIVIYTWLLRYVIFKRAESKQSVSLDSRDFNNFADLVKDLIVGECSIILLVMWVLLF